MSTGCLSSAFWWFVHDHFKSRKPRLDSSPSIKVSIRIRISTMPRIWIRFRIGIIIIIRIMLRGWIRMRIRIRIGGSANLY